MISLENILNKVFYFSYSLVIFTFIISKVYQIELPYLLLQYLN